MVVATAMFDAAIQWHWRYFRYTERQVLQSVRVNCPPSRGTTFSVGNRTIHGHSWLAFQFHRWIDSGVVKWRPASLIAAGGGSD